MLYNLLVLLMSSTLPKVVIVWKMLTTRVDQFPISSEMHWILFFKLMTTCIDQFLISSEIYLVLFSILPFFFFSPDLETTHSFSINRYVGFRSNFLVLFCLHYKMKMNMCSSLSVVYDLIMPQFLVLSVFLPLQA